MVSVAGQYTLSRAQLKYESVNATQMSAAGFEKIDTMLEADGVSTGLHQGRARRRRRGQANERVSNNGDAALPTAQHSQEVLLHQIYPPYARGTSPRAQLNAPDSGGGTDSAGVGV